MKRSVCFLITLSLAFVLLSIPVFAKDYDLGGTDISLSVDDSKWYVFTRDNIENNSELAELGVTYEKIYSVLYDNKAYMDALLICDFTNYDYLELFVRKSPIDNGVVNFSNYSDKEVLEFAEEIAEEISKEFDDKQEIKYTIFENDYKFIKFEYYDPNEKVYLCEYFTVVNKDNYTLTFQSETKFTDEKYKEMENIVNSVKFDVDESLKEKSFFETTAGRAVIGGVSGAAVAGLAGIMKKKKKKKQEQEQEQEQEQADNEVASDNSFDINNDPMI